MGIITSQSRFTETYLIPAIAEIIFSLKFLDSFEAAALSFEVFRPRRVTFSFCFCTSVAGHFFSSSPFLPKRHKLEREDGYSTKRNTRICLEMKYM